MRKILAAACAVMASCFVFSGCSLISNLFGGQSSEETLAAPTSLKMTSKGELTWDAVENATSYEIVIGDQVLTVDKNKQDLFALIDSEGDYTVSVSAVGGVAATYEFEAVQLGVPSKPVIAEDPETHAVKFVWEGDENTRSYLQEVNASGKWISNAENYFEITGSGSYTISVKAKGYAAKDVLYLGSAASEVSDTYEHKQGPVLQLTGMAVIDWTVEDGVEFDSYNLWIDGVKVKENVEKTDDGYALTGGSNPAITKTGEYNVQLEAVDNGYSYWSNMLVEVGTYNINEGEIYSFDNRIARFPVAKDGVSVSNEQYHGDSGHSLRYDANRAEQINLVKYADGTVNDIDYTTIRTISYWVYIEPIEGVEGNFPASDLPAPKWEKAWTNPDGNATYKQQPFRATQDVPYGEWTKVTIENIQNAYPNVLILQYAKTLAQDYVIYIDDITYEALWEDVEKDDADYEVQYLAYANTMGTWQSFDSTEIDLGVANANTTVTITMDVCGNVPDLADAKFGLFYDVVKDAGPIDFEFIWIDSAAISTLDTWTSIKVKVKTDAQGKTYLAGAYNQGAGKTGVYPFSIFIKNVEVATLDISEVDGTAMPAGTPKTGATGGYYQSVVGLPADYEVGTLVEVTMSIFVTGEYDEYTYIKWVDTVWTTEGGEINANYDVLTAADITANAGKWVRVTFNATVRSFDVLRLNSAYSTMDVSATEKGVYLVAANFTSELSFNYKDVTISVASSDVGKAMPAGTQKTANANGYYQAFVGLPTAYAVGTVVKVSMEIYVTGTYDQYSSGIKWVNSVYTTEGGEANETPTIVSVEEMDAQKGQWITVEFEATVRNFAVLRTGVEYATQDMSAYGNAIYLFAKGFKSEASFNYRNVAIINENDDNPGTAMLTGMKMKTGGAYYQSFGVIETEYEVGTAVTVSMEIYVTGTHDEWGGEIRWVGSVWTTEGGEVNAESLIFDTRTLTEDQNGQWIRVEFQATVCKFDVLRANNQQFDIMDVATEGNGIYLFAKNFTSAESFNYRNVVVTVD